MEDEEFFFFFLAVGGGGGELRCFSFDFLILLLTLPSPPSSLTSPSIKL